MPTIAAATVTLAEVRGTLSMMGYYRAFLHSDAQKYGECTDYCSRTEPSRCLVLGRDDGPR